MDEEYEKNKAKLWNEIEEGQTQRYCARITDFGAFVFRRHRWFLHVSEMASRANHPRDVVTEGDEIKFMF